MLLGQAVALGMDSLVLDISERLLACTPWEPRLCAHRAVAMINTGLPARAALNALRQCLNVYPGDPTALHYIELVQQWKPGTAAAQLPRPRNAGIVGAHNHARTAALDNRPA